MLVFIRDKSSKTTLERDERKKEKEKTPFFRHLNFVAGERFARRRPSTLVRAPLFIERLRKLSIANNTSFSSLTPYVF